MTNLFDTGEAPERKRFSVWSDWSSEPDHVVSFEGMPDRAKQAHRQAVRRINDAETLDALDALAAREHEIATALLNAGHHDEAFEIWDRLDARKRGLADQAAWEEAHAAAERTLAAKAAERVGCARDSANVETAENAKMTRNWNDVF